MIKKGIIFLLCFVMASTLWVPAGARTETLTTPDGLQYRIQDNEILITGHVDNWIASINIPSQIDGLPVTAIDNLAFYGVSVKSVIFPDTLRTIGYSAFAMCPSLKEINIPEGVTEIQKTTFFNCSDLQSITLPESLESIGQNAFALCESLQEIHLPQKVQQINSDAFVSTYSLTSIQVDDNNPYLSDIDGVLFSKDQRNLIYYPGNKPAETYTVPETVTHIDPYAFHAGSLLKNIYLPYDLTAVGDNAFSQSTGLETVVFSGKVKSLGVNAFFGCNYLKSVTLPETLINIPANCFSSCYSLTEINFPEGIIGIGSRAFSNCLSLEAVRLPDSVTRIEEAAFSSCKSLTEVTLNSQLQYIGRYAFSDCAEVKALYIPPSVTKIESRAVGYSSGQKIKDFTLSGEINSSAEVYALQNEIPFLCQGISYTDEVTGVRVIFKEEEALKNATFSVTKEKPTEGTYRYTVRLTDSDGTVLTPTQPFRMYIPAENDLVVGYCMIHQLEANGYQTRCEYSYPYTPTGYLFCFDASRLDQFEISQEVFYSNYGDITANGKIDATDALQILQHSVGKLPFTTLQQIKADVSADKKIDAYDALLVLKFLVYKLTSFPADDYPFPDFPDSTPSDSTPTEPPYIDATCGDVVA